MTKSLRMIEENLKLIDAVIYILDARAPRSCMNPTLDGLIQNKPVIYVLNKADLVEKSYLAKALEYFTDVAGDTKNGGGKSVVALNSTVSKSSTAIFNKIKELCDAKLRRAENRGMKVVLRAMVIGIPNGGKSTFINNLSGAGKATTGNKAGVTRGKQWVVVNEYFEVLDTPGTLYPKLDDHEKAKNLAYIGSISDDVLDTVELAQMLINDLDKLNPNHISDRYKLSKDIVADVAGGDNSENLRLENIARSRGFIRKGGVFDLEKAAVAVIDDFRKGRLGKIALEKFS